MVQFSIGRLGPWNARVGRGRGGGGAGGRGGGGRGGRGGERETALTAGDKAPVRTSPSITRLRYFVGPNWGSVSY